MLKRSLVLAMMLLVQDSAARDTTTLEIKSNGTVTKDFDSLMNSVNDHFMDDQDHASYEFV